MATTTSPAAKPDDESTISTQARARRTRHRQLVILGQAGIALVVILGWQIGAQTGFIDPFFFGSPLGIVLRLIDWFTNGTAYGSFWLQIWITLEEALLGFVAGVVSGIVVGVLLGEVPFLADVVGPYIKIVNALPRIVLGSIFVIWLGLGLPSKVLLAAVLVFFVVFFVAFLAVFLAGPLARFSASSSAARSRVIDSTASSRRRVALYSPSVTYGPNRPSLITTGWPETGSLPSSLSGALAAARPRVLGWA